MAKKRRRLGCCLLVLAAVAVPFLSLVALLVLAGPGRVQIAEGTALEIRLAGALREGPPTSALAQLFGPDELSLWNVRQALRAAAADPKISGVLLDIESFGSGLAVIEELLAELDAFRASGKPVRAFLRGDMIGEAEYLPALAAEEIVLAPEAGVLVNGLNVEVMFWRGTLDKLGIVPHVFMLREYKSAGEPFGRYEMSEPFRESLSALLSDVMGFIVATIAKRRGLDEGSVRLLMDRGILTSDEALQARLVDKRGYRDQLEQFFIDHGRTSEYRSVQPGKYVQSLQAKTKRRPKIAVIFGEGPIVASSESGGINPLSPGGPMIYGPQMAEAILEAANASQVRAIVLRINSPGGSPVGSDHVYRAVEKAKGRGKKVVVSMSDVAGSGGYWIAMNADRIVSHPTTITGSIGVVFTKFDLTGLYRLIGANVSQVKLGENADLMSETTGLEGARGERILAWMTHVYDSFKRKVAEGRGLSVEQVEAVARGRIWSGQAALGLRLVDALGGMDVALAQARELTGIGADEEVELVLYPEPKSWLEQLLSGNVVSTAVQGRAEAPLPTLDELRKAAAPRIELLAPAVRLD
jgi:protease IV